MPRELRTRAVEDIPEDANAGSRHVPTGRPPGAPRKAYLEKRSTESRRDDERETLGHLSNIPYEQATEAVLLLLRQSGKKELEYVVSKLLRGAWDPKMVRERVEHPNPPVSRLSPFDGLQILMDCNMPVEQYNTISRKVATCGMHVLPCYARVARAKEDCRPDRGITITESCGRAELQPLLEHTLKRAVLAEGSILDSFFGDSTSLRCTFYCAFGFDASTGQSMWHKKFRQERGLNALERPDHSVIFASLNPLRLATDSEGIILWENPVPASSRYVRPIMIQFAKETQEYCIQLYEELKEEILALSDLRAQTKGGNLIIAKPKLFMTMIDQKVLAHLMDTSSQCCAICGAKPSEYMNPDYLDTVTLEPFEDALNFGISPLHCWINFMNHLNKLAFHQPIRQNRAIGEENKRKCRRRKQQIQQALFDEFGVKIDVPNPNGSGNSNTGNVARRIFQNPVKYAEILDIDRDLVVDLKTVLICISSSYRINPGPFKQFCRGIFHRYREKYAWYNLSPTIHKVLEHGADIARNFPLPLEHLTEEGAEAKHKDHKRMRRGNTRKTDWSDAMHDFMYRSMDKSDPMLAKIATDRASKYKRFYRIPEEARPYLILNEGNDTGDYSDVDQENEEHVQEAALEAALDEFSLENEDDIDDQ